MVDYANLLSPSQQTSYAQQAVSSPTASQILTNGMASYPADFLRDQSTAKLLMNMLQSRRQGVWTNRDNGISKYVATQFNSGAKFYDFGLFLDSSGNQQLVFQCGNELIYYNLATATTTVLAGSYPITSNDTFYAPAPCIREFQPFQAGATSVSVVTHPGVQNAATISQAAAYATFFGSGGSAGNWLITASPLQVKDYSYPAFCEPFLNRMVYTGFPIGANSQDVLITNAGTYNTLTQNSTPLDTDGVVVQVPAICGRITGVKAVQLNNSSNAQALIIGCQRGVCLVQGTGALSFGLTVLTLQYGIPSNRAYMQVQNDMIFLSNDGIRSFSSLVINANLLTSSLSYGLQDYVQNWDQAYLNRAFVVGNRNTKDIQFWMPQLGPNGVSSSGVCNLCFVMNYGSSSFGVQSVPQLNFTPSLRGQGLTMPCAIEVQDPNNNNTWTMLSGGYTGYLYKNYSGNLNDTTALPALITFPLATATGNPATGTSLRKISIITEGGAQNFYANATALEMMASGTIIKQQSGQAAFDLSTAGQLTTTLGSWVLGQSAFPANYTQLLEYEPTLEGRFIELQLACSSANNFLDLIGAHFIFQAGGTRR
jgi:hypothetical protein